MCRLFAALALSALVLTAQQGPKKESGDPVARPRRPATPDVPKPEENLPKIPSRLGVKKDPNAPVEGPTFRAETLTVNVDVSVLDNKGRFIPGIPGGNFRILEDGVPQKLSNFAKGEAPMTLCMVIEFSNLFQQYWSQGWYETLTATYGFVETLRPEDQVAVVAYDLRPEILSDFSTDRRNTYEALQRLRIAAFSESNMYDALVDTATRMQDLEGRKAILLIASGLDTFSKLTFDKTRRELQTAGVPIYAVSILQAWRERMDAYGAMGPIARLDFLQADNQLRTFSRETGGQAFFPRFLGEFPGIFRALHEALRNQYMLAYQPSNASRDGKYRKIKVDLVNPKTGEPLKITDEKGKPIKYSIVAKQGYYAPRTVE
jgi:VWFA-related protein